MIRNNTNNKIKSSMVLLVDNDGNNQGKVPTSAALDKAVAAGLDLVEVGISDGIPVCRIIDFAKWEYDQQKRSKKGHAQKTVVKELQFRPTTSNHDLTYRAKQVDKFLTSGDKIKLTVKFKGREQEHMLATGKALLERFLGLIKENYSVDSDAQIAGNCITLIIFGGKKA